MATKSKLPTLERSQIVITKSERKLELFERGRLIKTYTIGLGFSPAGMKEIEGDGKTPEGKFYVFTKNAESKFHLSLGISYPGTRDAERGLKDKLITQEEYDDITKAIGKKGMPPQKTKLGGEIYIHGDGIDGDWTDGCIALRNEEIKEIFDAIPVGTEVVILR